MAQNIIKQNKTLNCLKTNYLFNINLNFIILIIITLHPEMVKRYQRTLRRKRRKKYIQKLFDDEPCKNVVEGTATVELSIPVEETGNVILKLKANKAMGIDKVQSDIEKMIQESNLKFQMIGLYQYSLRC